MEINIRDDKKLVEIWLTRAEADDAALREQLGPFYKKWQGQKYLVAVFLSGDQDLCDCTSELLRYNRRRIAELETEREKAGMAATM